MKQVMLDLGFVLFLLYLPALVWHTFSTRTGS